ncbi:hypothetical protein M153_888000233, partial [Pseudoloma neurophilia]
MILNFTKETLSVLCPDQADLLDENTFIRIVTESIAQEITNKNSTKKSIDAACKLIDLLKQWIDHGDRQGDIHGERQG